MKPTFHAASIKKSERLKRLLRFMRARATIGATPFDISRETNSVRSTSDLSELKANGFEFRKRYEGEKDGRRYYRYWLVN